MNAEIDIFDENPDEISEIIRSYWTESEEHLGMLLEILTVHFEREAVKRLEKEINVPSKPKLKKGDPENWRYFWLNEAYQNCSSAQLPRAGGHLSAVGAMAVQTLITSSWLWEAIDNGKTNQALILMMLLVSDIYAGGYYYKGMERDAKTKEHFSKTIGKYLKPAAVAKTYCTRRAAVLFKEVPTPGIGAVAKRLQSELQEKNLLLPPKKKSQNQKPEPPKVDTIKGWIRTLAPESASRKGRPRATN